MLSSTHSFSSLMKIFEQNAMWIILLCPFDTSDHSTVSLSYRFVLCLGRVMRGTSRKVPALGKFKKGHNPHIKSLIPTFFVPHAFGRSLSLHILKCCWLWNWKSHNCFVLQKAKVKFGSFWSDGKILPCAVLCMMLPMIWEGMDTQGDPERPPVLICVFSILVCEIYD